MLIKKLFSVLLFLYLLSVFVFSVSAVDISARSAIVMNADTKEIVFEKNAFEKLSMASTTKIMTSILALESGMLSEAVTAVESAFAEGTSIGLKKGDVVSLENLVYGMMLESGNDAANLTALFLGGTIESFVSMMNGKAAQIGMKNTNFVTPSGLDSDEHYSTAYDMALLGAYSIKNPQFKEISSCKSKAVKFICPEKNITFYNHNRLLESCEGVFGIKTGFTKKSGRCLVSACERDGATLVCVTLNAGDDWNDHKKLYDLSFSELNKSTVKALDFNSIRVYGSDKNEIEVHCDDYVYFYSNDNVRIRKEILLPPIIYAPIKENQVIGHVNYYIDGELAETLNIFASENANCSEVTYKEKRSFKEWIKNIFNLKG